MKILIIGEFSSFSKNLASGFRQLGHETFVFSWGDGFKKIKQENSYLVKPYSVAEQSSILVKIKSIYTRLKEKKRLRDFVYSFSKTNKYDVVLIINPNFISYGWKFWQVSFTKKMILSLCKNPNQIYLSACGNDLPYIYYWSKNKSKNFLLIERHKYYKNNYELRKIKYINSFIHKVIPTMYDYSQAWGNCPFLEKWLILPTIPLPIDLSNIKMDNKISDKLVIFHGITRPLDKGTPYILGAMDKIQNEYKDKVICIAKGNMPLEEYKRLLSEINISIDQVYAYSTGMNGLYSLAMGKVLLSGNEPENMKEFNYDDIPTINIGPDSEMIYNKLKYIVENPDVIQELSRKGREYIEKIHEVKIVAQKYIEIFTTYKEK